jgi:hypothetical protein
MCSDGKLNKLCGMSIGLLCSALRCDFSGVVLTLFSSFHLADEPSSSTAATATGKAGKDESTARKRKN